MYQLAIFMQFEKGCFSQFSISNSTIVLTHTPMPTSLYTERKSVTQADLIEILEASGSKRLTDAYLAYFGHIKSPERLPFRNPNICIPGLSTMAWHDPAQFDWVPRLEAAYPTISQELTNLQALDRFQAGDNPGGTFYQGSWNTYMFKQGEIPHKENCDRCPQTARLILSIPRLERFAFFAALDPNSHISAHHGLMNEHLVCQLGLCGLEKAEVRVADETRQWKAGKFLMYDGSFEHEVWNRGDFPRIVLAVFIWHPGFTSSEIQAIQSVRRLIANTYRSV